MSNYTKTTNFLAKDSLPENDSGKIIKGSEFDTEFNNLQTAVNTKADLASPTLTGVPTAPTATVGTNTTQVATTAFVNSAANTARTYSTLQTFQDTAFEVVDNGDATKKLNLQLSGITTATTRTLTIPNKNGTIATTDDLTQGAPLNAAANTVVSGSYAATSSATITITATNTFSVGQTVFITFTNTSGSALTAGDFTIVTATGSSFTINYGSSVTSAGTCVTTRYGIIALASSADVLAGTNTTRAVSSSTVKNVLLGVDQTWQDVTSSRAAGTTYTNSTGKPIQVFISMGTSAGGSYTITIGGLSLGGSMSVPNNIGSSTSFIVPNNTTYVLTLSSATLSKWTELR